jgi:hypothetical protein
MFETGGFLVLKVTSTPEISPYLLSFDLGFIAELSIDVSIFLVSIWVAERYGCIRRV